jgi:hypothetical protein
MAAMQRFKNWSHSFTVVVVLSAGTISKAQGTYDALTFSPGGPIVGYVVADAIGWSFTPTTNIRVIGIAGDPPSQITFWQGPDQPLGSFAVSSPSWPNSYTGQVGSFDPITPLLLSAGQLYFVSEEPTGINRGSPTFAVYNRSGAGQTHVFYPSSYIGQIANYTLASDGTWSPWPDPNYNTDLVCLGPNFQFQVVPEPATLGLLCCGLSTFMFFKKWGTSSRTHPFSATHSSPIPPSVHCL